MSTIAARAHSGASLAAPVRRPAQPRRAPPASALRRIGRLVGRRPGRTLLLLAFSAVAVAILVNAMLFQKARHPAPIVSAPQIEAPKRQVERQVERRPEAAAAGAPAAAPAAAAPAPSPAAAPLPPSRPSDLVQGAREAAAPRPPAPVTAIPRTPPATTAAPAPAPARSAAARDPIADLINGADFRPPADIRGGARPAPRRAVEN